MQITENPLHHCQIGLVLLVFLLCLTRRLTYHRTAVLPLRGAVQSKHSTAVASRRRARGARCARQVGGNISEDNLQFTLAANAFSNLSLLFADNGVNILVRVGKRIH